MDLQSDLSRAVMEGNSEAVRWLLTEGHNATVRQRDGRTLLHLAVQSKLSVEVFEKLLQEVDVTLRDINFHSVLQLVVEDNRNVYREAICDYIRALVTEGRLEQIQHMMQCGWNFWPRDATDQLMISKELKEIFSTYQEVQMTIEALHTAAAEGNGRVLFRLLAQKQNLLRYCDVTGLSLLHKAVVFEQTETVRYLVEYFPDLIHDTNDMKLTPLHYATGLCDNGMIFNILMKAGADEDTPDLSGYTPAFYMSEPALFTVGTIRSEVVNLVNKSQRTHTFSFMKQVYESQLEDMTDEWEDTDVLDGESGADGDASCQDDNARDNVGMYDENTAVIDQGYKQSRVETDGDQPDGLEETSDLNNYKYPDPQSSAYGRDENETETEVRNNADKALVNPIIPVSVLNNSDSGSTNVTNGRTDFTDSAVTRSDKFKKPTPNDDFFKCGCYASIVAGDYETFVQLIDADVDDIHRKNHADASTYLHLAVLNHTRVEIVRELIARVDITHRNTSGQTALDLARNFPLNNLAIIHEIHKFVEAVLLSDDLETIKGWVIKGWNAWPKVVDSLKVTTRMSQFLQSITAFQEKVDLVHKCVSVCNIRLLRQLVTRKGLALAKDATGLSPLHKAVVYGSISIVRFLVQVTSEVLSSTDQCGRTALHYAAVNEDKGHLFSILKKFGSDASVIDLFGHTADDYRKNYAKFTKPMTQHKIGTILMANKGADTWNVGDNLQELTVTTYEELKSTNKTVKPHRALPKLHEKPSTNEKPARPQREERKKKVLSMLQLSEIYKQRSNMNGNKVNQWNGHTRRIVAKPNGARLQKIDRVNRTGCGGDVGVIEDELKTIKVQANLRAAQRKRMRKNKRPYHYILVLLALTSADHHAMVLVTCPCLNIKISIKEPSLEFAPDIDENSLSSEARSNKFFLGSKLVHLTSSGLQQEHEYLVQRQWVGGWWVHTCVVCDTHTYAMDPHSSDGSDGGLLISPSLISDDAMVERLRNSYHYSPSFRCLLKDTTNMPQMSPGCSLDFVPYIQQEVTAYLMTEEAAMEDRVRKFEQAERTKFMEIQNRLKSDKKKLISLVLQNSKDNLNSQSPTKKSLAHSRSTPLHMDRHNMNQRSSQATDNNNRPPARHPDLLLDNDEELFHMEGNDETYAMSEDDGLDTDDSCAIEHSSSPTLFSSSVPVNVPTWRGKTSPPDWPEHVPEEEGAPDIDQIHANIQALAKSVHDSSKEIFGDLPRPRMNTFCGRPSNR